MSRIPHLPIIIGLITALLVAFGIGVSGKFQIYDNKGILSGPFSALLLLSAVILALLVLVFIDWKVFLPKRIEKSRATAKWLNNNVLGNATEPNDNWSVLKGSFRGREVELTRASAYGARGLRWALSTKSDLDLLVTRLEMPMPPAPAQQPTLVDKPPVAHEQAGGTPAVPEGDLANRPTFSTGDEDFESLYAWQTPTPEKVLPLLKNDDARSALKRLASLVAVRGKPTQADVGVRVANGKISLIQAPVPELSSSRYTPEEALMILHDLTLLASHLENSPLPTQGAVKELAHPQDTLSAWLALGCFGITGIVAWMGATWAAAHFLSLAMAMVVFFIPPVLLAFTFMLVSAGSGRAPEVEEVIRKESLEIVKKYPDLAALAELIRSA